uniref:alpha/beta fold hydrolase n=1 Tax=Mycobacterium hubeiense TaxID=1867256 RepID=UPI001159285C
SWLRSAQPTTPKSPGGRERRVIVDDGWVHVTEWGSPEADVTVVLTLGWTLSGRIWETVAASMVEADPSLRVLAYDHRGHGNSFRPLVASIEHLADDLAAVIGDVVPRGRIVFGGHSLGGMTLMALAQRHPQMVAERTTGVAFVATSAGHLLGALRRVRGMEALLGMALMLAGRLRTPSKPLFLVRQGARGGFGKSPRRYDLNRAVLQSAQADPRTVAALGRSILQHNRYDALAAFHDLDAIVMAGTRDFLTSPAHAYRIADYLPNSRVVVFQDAGHFLPYERHREVAAQLLALTANARRVEASRIEVAG